MGTAPKVNSLSTPCLMGESSTSPTTAHAAHRRPDTNTSLTHACLQISLRQHPRSRCGRYHNALLSSLQDGMSSEFGATRSPFFSDFTLFLRFLLMVYTKNNCHSYNMHESCLSEVLPFQEGKTMDRRSGTMTWYLHLVANLSLNR